MKTKQELKKYFENGDIPVQEEFWEWQESYWHKDEKIPSDKLDYDFFKKADANASNINPQNAQLWKDKIETQTSIQNPQLNGNILTIFYTGENGVQQSQNVDLSGLVTNNISIQNAEYDASQNIITITQSDGSSFAINLSEFSIIPATNSDGSVSLVQEGVEKVRIHKVGISGSYNDLSDKPVFAGNDTLQSVTDRGNSSTNAIVFNADQGRAGELNFNKTSYSHYFGNHSNNNSAYYTVAIGYNTLSALTTGQSNVGIGSYALEATTTGTLNTAVGVSAGQKLTTGQYNAYFGWASGSSCTTGNANTMIGDEAGNRTTTGYKNTFVGMGAGYFNTTGNLNTLIGWKANNQSNLGDRNIMIGVSAGSGVTGNNNVLIGTGAGMNDGAIGNKLIIHGNQTLTGYSNTAEGNFGSFQQGQLNRALITGDFVERWVRMNAGFLQIGSPASNADDITITPTAGITAAKLYTPASNNDYVQRGWVSNNYYNQAQINSLLSRTYHVMGSVTNFGALPTTGQMTGDVWNLLDTGENYVWVDNLNNTGIPGWDKLSGVVDITGFIPLGGTNPGQLITGDLHLKESVNFINYVNASYNSRFALEDGGFGFTGTGGSGSDTFSLIVSQAMELNFTSSFADSKGITSDVYYGKNYDDNSFIQKKYADKQHSYTRDEELTGGTWINGKPVYKKTLYLNQIPRAGEIDLRAEFPDLETIISNEMFTEWYALDIAFAGNQWRSKIYITIERDKAIIELLGEPDYDYSIINSFTLTLEYTKK
jgi:carbonic anhydrase/acetyltransferase-like protein (isoleucine patch superfamily)